MGQKRKKTVKEVKEVKTLKRSVETCAPLPLCPGDPENTGITVARSYGMTGNSVIGIDPGITGAIVVTDGKDLVYFPMPVIRNGKTTEISFAGVIDRLRDIENAFGKLQVALERAVPMAMGSKSAFNYGRGFQAILDAIAWCEFPFTLIEPQKWAKEMHEGISVDLRPKAKSVIAVKRLFPALVRLLPVKPKSKALQDGPIDALLIAGYWLRKAKPVKDEYDFW